MNLIQSLAFFGFAGIPIWLGLAALAREMTRGNHRKTPASTNEETGD